MRSWKLWFNICFPSQTGTYGIGVDGKNEGKTLLFAKLILWVVEFHLEKEWNINIQLCSESKQSWKVMKPNHIFVLLQLALIDFILFRFLISIIQIKSMERQQWSNIHCLEAKVQTNTVLLKVELVKFFLWWFLRMNL